MGRKVALLSLVSCAFSLRWLPPAAPPADLPPGNTLRRKLSPDSGFHKICYLVII